MTELDPRLFTSTVCDLLEAIRDERGWDRLPILSDALQDAGCDDDGLILYLRKQTEECLECLDWFVDHSMKTNGGKKPSGDDLLNAIARWSRSDCFRTIKDFAEELGCPEYYDDDYKPVQRDPMTFKKLMDAATDYVTEEEYLHMGTNEHYKNIFWDRIGIDNMEKFWQAYDALTGKTVENRTAFFSCAC